MAAAYLSCTLQDSYGRTTKRVYEMDSQLLLADYDTAATAFGLALADVTDLALIRADLIVPAIIPGFAVTAGANVDVGATFQGLVVDGNGKKASVKLPGIKAALVDSDGTVEITGDIATWLAEFTDGEDFMLSDGEQIDSWIKGTLDR